MSGFLALVWLCMLGTIGYWAFRRARLPMPALLGSLTATAVLALAGRYSAAAPVGVLSAVCKVVLGAMMGRRLHRGAVGMLRRLVVPALMIAVWMICLSVSGGYLLSYLSGLPLSTAMIGAATGGVSEMAIFALSMNYDVATITMIGVSRLVFVLAFTPWLARCWAERTPREPGIAEAGPRAHSAGLGPVHPAFVMAFAGAAAAGGLLFNRAGVPAGFMLGALFATGGLSLAANRVCALPNWIVRAAQVGIGVTIGGQFGPEQWAFFTAPRFLLSLVACGLYTVSASVALAWLVRRVSGLDPLVCLLSCSAGGLTQIVVIAEDMGADSLTIGVLHLARYLAIVSCMPFLIRFLLS